MKKVYISVIIVFVAASILLFMPGIANAQGNGSTVVVKCEDINSDGKPDDNIQKFLAFPTWYRGLDCDAGSKGIHIAPNANAEVGTVIFTVSLNIIDIALRLIGIMAVGFVIYGGFQYVISRGEPEHTKAAHPLPFRHCEPLIAAWQSTRAHAY